MIDGDNQGDPFPQDDQFIHLPYYCIENMMLDPETLAATSGRPLLDVQAVIVGAINSQRKAIFQKNKFFEFLADRIAAAHMTFENLRTFDASLVVANVFTALGIAGLNSYLATARASGRIDDLIPLQLRRVLESAVPKAAGHPTGAPPTAEAAPAEARVENAAAQPDAAGG